MLRLYHVFPYDAENSWPINPDGQLIPSIANRATKPLTSGCLFREDCEILNFPRTEGGIRLAFWWQVWPAFAQRGAGQSARELAECCVSRLA